MISFKWLKSIAFVLSCLCLAVVSASAQDDDELVLGLTQEALDRVLEERVEEAAANRAIPWVGGTSKVESCC